MYVDISMHFVKPDKKKLVFSWPILERIKGYKLTSLRENPKGSGSAYLSGELE